MPRAALGAAAARGHQAEHVRDINLGDATDDEIAEHAHVTGAVLVTRDLDFADIRRVLPADCQGVLVLRVPDNSTAHQIAEVLDRFLGSDALVAQLPGRLAILELSRVRFRPGLSE